MFDPKTSNSGDFLHRSAPTSDGFSAIHRHHLDVLREFVASLSRDESYVTRKFASFTQPEQVKRFFEDPFTAAKKEKFGQAYNLLTLMLGDSYRGESQILPALHSFGVDLTREHPVRRKDRDVGLLEKIGWLNKTFLATPLILLAANRFGKSGVSTLLTLGVDPNHSGSHGLTAFHVAEQQNYYETMQVLFSVGADPRVSPPAWLKMPKHAYAAGSLGDLLN